MALQVRGKEAMQRIFPGGVPDSVKFSWRWDDGEDIERTVHVMRASRE
jgi:hypothetical protein